MIEHNGHELHASGTDTVEPIEPTIAELGERIFAGIEWNRPDSTVNTRPSDKW